MFYIIIYLREATLTTNSVVFQSSARTNTTYSQSVYFLKGNDPRLLNLDQQKEIAGFVAKDNLATSILVYNPAEALQKMNNWKNALPWIQPHYAIKSCPSMELIKDLAGQGAGMDCASRA